MFNKGCPLLENGYSDDGQTTEDLKRKGNGFIQESVRRGALSRKSREIWNTSYPIFLLIFTNKPLMIRSEI